MATSSHPPLLLCLHTIPLILLQSEHYLHGNRLLQPVVSIATARGLEVGGGQEESAESLQSSWKTREHIHACIVQYLGEHFKILSLLWQWPYATLTTRWSFTFEWFERQTVVNVSLFLPPAVRPQAVAPPEPGCRPLLSGHSCRWTGYKTPLSGGTWAPCSERARSCCQKSATHDNKPFLHQ